MGKNDGRDIGMVDELVHQSNTCVVNDDNCIAALIGNLTGVSTNYGVPALGLWVLTLFTKVSE